jgi:sialate O-acetylesterase
MLKPFRVPLTLIFLICAAGLSFRAGAAIRLPVLFSDSMVLQSERAARVWGWADDGELVVVQFKSQVLTTRATGGKWSVNLKPMKATRDPGVLAVMSDHGSIEFTNVVVGEVWIASGQSNMQWPLKKSDNWTRDAAASANPNLRLFYVPRTAAEQPRDDIEGEHLGRRPTWEVAGPDSTPEFSAVGYYFGRDLQKNLDVPVGIIHSSWGGTPAELWASENGLRSKGDLRREFVDSYPAKKAAYEKALAAYREKVSDAKKGGKKYSGAAPRAPRRAASLYNAMIHPLLPYAIKGAIWYQGEANASRAYQYRSLFPLMIQSWRDGWKQGDFPFYAVELAPWDFNRKRELEEIVRKPVDSTWAELREAQIHAGRVLPNVGTVTITDVGMKDDIHPTNKGPVGARLAALALGETYGKDVMASGPTYNRHTVKDGAVNIFFDHAGDGLVADGGEVTGFSIAGSDGVFVWANAKIVGNTVVVSHPNIKRPAGVRFGWADYPVVNLRNKSGLPAHPFRTDNFPLTTKPAK